MDKDIFESTAKPAKNNRNDENNFFMQSEDISLRGVMPSETSRHLNDYDFNILKEDAYREVDDELFRLEYKISRIEDEIKDLEKQIQSANVIHDYFHADSLYKRKLQLENDLKALTDFYKEASLSAKISGGFTSNLKKGYLSLQNLLSKIFDKIISKMPHKISSILAVRSSLSKLENINKSVDDLIRYQYPYGEAAVRYEQLSKYIAKANSIQSEIYKFMK